ncbi:MAG: hypothetical protein COW55_12720 [Rhodobacteraceae bacterium CG17_big_fil_post_rev_8_21_14_2_50_65_11]|nr:MAG: hypothetical protein COW55_12720 [Rhodobacteraceae bacterium CG17_big_fil_post_rev_8_21_14_2_50_65_11]
MLKRFILSESGAVTTDYVMLSASVVGLGIAVVSSTSMGVETLANDINAALTGEIVNASFARSSYFDDFESGAGFWVGGQTDDSEDAYGGILGPYGGTDGVEAVTRTYDLMSGYDMAVVEFDLHAIDSWDNEDFIVFIDGEPVSSHNFRWQEDGATGGWTTSDGNYVVSIEPNGPRQHTGYNPDWTDQSYSVRVEVTDPGRSMSVGFGSTLTQSLDDESWAVDNVGVTSTNDPGEV